MHNQYKSLQKKNSRIIPLNSMANLNELNSALIFFLHDNSSYTTGINMVTDRGRSTW